MSYAILNKEGNLSPSEYVVGTVSPNTINIKKHLRSKRTLAKLMMQGRIKPIPFYKQAPATLTASQNEEIVVLMIDFMDLSGTQTPEYFNRLVFGSNPGNMRHYYNEVSYGQLFVYGSIVGSGWLLSSHTLDYYAADTGPQNNDPTTHDDGNGNIHDLVREAVQLADAAGVDFSQFDNNGDGIIDHILVIHAGNGQESSGQPNDIWSHRWGIQGGELVDGVWAYGYTLVAETSPVGIFCHEFFHDIGAGDLYDSEDDHDDLYPVGEWCLMSAGSWANFGNIPTHPCGYLKMDIDADATNGYNGWLGFKNLNSEQSRVSLRQLKDPNGDRSYRVNIPGTNQYFLLENGYNDQTDYYSYDDYLPESGIVIYHIDEDMPDGTGGINDGPLNNTYYRTWVEDPSDASHLGASRSGAAYSTDDGQMSFTPLTNPSSNANDGSASNISITNISS